MKVKHTDNLKKWFTPDEHPLRSTPILLKALPTGKYSSYYYIAPRICFYRAGLKIFTVSKYSKKPIIVPFLWNYVDWNKGNEVEYENAIVTYKFSEVPRILNDDWYRVFKKEEHGMDT